QTLGPGGRGPFGFHGAWIPQAPAVGRRTIQPPTTITGAAPPAARPGTPPSPSRLCPGSAFGGRAQGRSVGAAAGAAGGRLTGLVRAPRHDAAAPGRMGDLHPAALGLR